MASKVRFSWQNVPLPSILIWYQNDKAALESYKDELINSIDKPMPIQSNDRGLTLLSLNKHFNELERELEHLFSFDVVAATEAILRIDFYSKVYHKSKSDIARHFQSIHKLKGNDVSLEHDILEAWKRFEDDQKNKFSDLIGLLKYRHWIAHGRYWEPRFGMNYNFRKSYDIARNVTDFIASQNVPGATQKRTFTNL